jgi:DNA invertase Pin-like site-specific DNA recombinase
MKAAIYLRQSKDDELGIDRQREDTLTLCKAKGWTPTEYADNDCSASNGDRPRYQEMLDDIRAGLIDAVVVAQLDRLHRRPIELEEFIALADQHHLALECASGGDVDLATDGRFMARIMGAVARKEMERKSWRQKRAAEQRAENGDQWWSIRPFGYARQPVLDDAGKPVVNKNGRRLWKPVLDPTEADLLREAYRAVLNDSSLYAVTSDWNTRGIPTPRGNKWRASQMRQLLLSPRNAGLRTFRGGLQMEKEEPRKANWEPVVDQETWQGVVDLLADPDRRCGLSRARKHLLSNIAVCGLCGSGLGSGVTSRPRQTPIYTCKACNGLSRNAARVDEMAVEAVVARLSRPDAIELTIPEERGDLDELRERARALRARLTALATEFADGDLTASQIKTATRRINEQLAEIDAVIRDSQQTRVFAGVVGADDVWAAFDGLDLERQRRIIDALITVTVHPAGRGRTFRPESIQIDWK